MWQQPIFDPIALIALSAGIIALVLKTISRTYNLWIWVGSVMIVIYFIIEWVSEHMLTHQDVFLMIAIGMLVHGVMLGANKSKAAIGYLTGKLLPNKGQTKEQAAIKALKRRL